MRLNNPGIGIVLLAATGLVATVAAQTPTFQPLMTGTTVENAQYVAGRVYAGLPQGGVVVWDVATGEALATLTRRDGLGGHFVNDLAWTGERLWIATSDGGLTVVSDPGGPSQSMRVHSSLLASLDVTAVSGQVVGNTERVYYGTDGAGIGEFVGGLAGAYYSTQNGLIDDTVDAVALSGDLLLIATPSGVSRFAANSFTNYPYGGEEPIRTLAVGGDGFIYAARADGAFRWDDDSRQWVVVYGAGQAIDLAVDGDSVWALTWAGVVRIDGGGVATLALPSSPAGFTRIPEALAAGDDGAFVCGYMEPDDQPSFTAAAQPWVAPAGDAVTPIRPIDSLQIGAAGGMDGVAIDSRNRPWLGDREGDGLGSYDGSVWYNAIERASADNDSSGLINFGGGLLIMARDNDALWFNQYVAGVIRLVPAEAPGGVEDWLQLTPFNSPLQGDSHESIAVHPDGVIFFGTSNAALGAVDNSQLGVDVLVDQTRPRDPASWLHLYPADLGGQSFIGAIAVEQRDVIWFAVRNVGLLRWDVNGPNAGPDDPLTWFDDDDDEWSDPITNLPGSELDLGQGSAIVAAGDGSLFVGGQGLVRFSYQPVLGLVTPLGEWTLKDSALDDGLLGQTVSGLGFDHNGALWVLSSGGLNRMRFGEETVDIDAYTDLATYLTFDSSFYSTNIISPLPGGVYRGLDMAADGRSLVLSSDLGGTVVQIPEVSGEVEEEDISAAYLYPNPFPGEDLGDHVNVGGIDIDADMTVNLEVLNLAGQIVYRSTDLTSGEMIWDGRTREDRRVASGLYVVKIQYGGKTVVRTLAVAY